MKEFSKTINSICKKNIVVIIMIVFLCPILGYSYSSFIASTDKYKVSEMYMGNLLYSIKINNVATNQVVVPANDEVEIVLEVTSLNEVSSNYKVVYNTNPSITAVYADDDNTPTQGLITTTKTSTVLLTNSSASDITISFDIVQYY